MEAPACGAQRVSACNDEPVLPGSHELVDNRLGVGKTKP